MKTTEHWHQVEDLFHAAIEREPGQRAEFLSRACGSDHELLAEVQSLVASHENEDSFINSPAYAAAPEVTTTVALDNAVPRLIGRYEVLELLGRGGMGEVYLARDVQLGRRVALKTLPERYTQDPDRVRRFKQEARAASGLTHPNIITIYEIGVSDTNHFIAAEFIEGTTISRSKKNAPMMTVSETLNIAIQVATGLTAAHAAGIVHRDIKPDNIMLRPDGYVKILDFGIAKLTEQNNKPISRRLDATTEVETAPGLIIGSPNYMSPEQARGLEIDERTDIFSLGVVLYEILAARRPFEGDTLSDVIAAILEKEPVPLANYRREIPDQLQSIVSKALRKERQDRYQTAQEMLHDLKELKNRLEFEAALEGSAAAASRRRTDFPGIRSSRAYLFGALERHRRIGIGLALIATVIGCSFFVVNQLTGVAALESIAVLPFVNVNGDSETEYISDEIPVSISNNLSQLRQLRVMARGTVFTYKGKEVDPRTVAGDLNVRAIVTGRVLQQSDRLTISVELVDATNGKQLWGNQYSRKSSDILAVEEDIVRHISMNLRIKFTGEENQKLMRRNAQSVEAYHAYLKGRHYRNQWSVNSFKKGLDYSRQAVDIDPSYAQGWAGLAFAYYAASNTVVQPDEAMPKASKAAQTALEIDDSSVDAHTVLALIKSQYEWDWTGAEREFKRAIEISPNDEMAHASYGSFLLLEHGRFDEAIAELTRARKVDPLSSTTSAWLTFAHYLARDYDETIKQCRKILDADSNNVAAHYNLGMAYEEKLMFEEAIAEFQLLDS